MLSTPRIVTLVIISAVFAYVIIFTSYIPQSYHAIQSSAFPSSADTSNSTEPFEQVITQKNTSSTSSTSVAGVPQVDDGPEDSDGLLDLCNETKWVEGLWLHCHSDCGANHTSICGGLNNARNRVQTCIRLAIDAGAGVIIPSATVRDENELVHTDGTTVCPDVFWNMEYLKSQMSKQCPQLQIRICDDKNGIENTIVPPSRQYLTPAHSKATFRELVKETFAESNFSLADTNAANPTLIEYADTYIGWNYKISAELSTIRKALFKVLRFNKDLLDLSTEVLQSPQLKNGAFIGVHLRGEKDWSGEFGTIDDQMRLYAAEIEQIQTTISYNVTTIYVSCGDVDAIQRFRDLLEPLGYAVHDKWTILADQPDTLARVEGLGFDEKGIIEYKVLVDARFWLGLIMSSMSSLIAYARSVNEKDDYFETFIFPGSSKNGLDRGYPDHLSMKGNRHTKLMVVNGVDIMDSFP